jgi:hypothetical protein
LLIYREGKTLFDGLGHSYHIKRTSKISEKEKRKRKKDYVAVFSSILELLTLLGEPRVEEFMMDFEAAMWQVFAFLNVNLQ